MGGLIAWKARIEVALITAAILSLIAFSMLMFHRNAVQAAYLQGRTDLRQEIAERTEELRRGLLEADIGEGDPDEDMAWIDNYLDSLGMRPNGARPDGGSTPGRSPTGPHD